MEITTKERGGIFFNTTQETGNQLKEGKVMTSNQDAKVLAVFFANKNKSFNPWEIMARIGGRKILIGSVRRAIHALYKREFITRSGVSIGKAGRKNFSYKFKKTK
jgi:predicted transcriptional regulator